jgi:hypothetical protein
VAAPAVSRWEETARGMDFARGSKSPVKLTNRESVAVIPEQLIQANRFEKYAC